MRHLILLLLLLFSTPAYAGLHLGVSNILVGYTNTSLSYNVGYSHKTKYGFVDLTSNVLYPTTNNDNIRGFYVESEVTHYTAFFGKKFGRWALSPLLSYVKVDNKVYLGNVNILRDKINAVVYGFNATYFTKIKGVAGSISCLGPNTEINLKFSCGLGVNYYFSFK